jgi:prevent-host-death family protein
METVSVHEAKTQFTRLLERVHAGEEVIIAKAGKPYAKLVPLDSRLKERLPGIAKGALTTAFFEPLSEEELSRWE